MSHASELKQEARSASLLRNHKMTRFYELGPKHWRSLCLYCNAWVDVRTKPAPNEAPIGGTAVAEDCI